jgi:FlaA1/EpsC-like NDP-sugar epimerase
MPDPASGEASAAGFLCADTRRLPWCRVRGGMVLGADGAATAAGLTAALWLRFEGELPESALEWLPQALPIAVGARMLCNAAIGIHRWSFRSSGLIEALRVGAAGVAGTTLLVVLWSAVLGHSLPPSIGALELFVTTALFGLLRFAPRAALRWRSWLSTRRAPERALVVGDGATAELLVRELQRTSACQYRVLGCVSQEPGMVGSHLAGAPVLGTVANLPQLLRRQGVSLVLLADPAASLAHVQRVVDMASACHVRFKVVRARLESVDPAATRDGIDLLLHRPAIPFEAAELRALIHGRRAMVTGAGGSIGGELCRQLARLGAAQLVMVDMNENELYLGARRLAEAWPRLDVHPVVADVREATPLLRLGLRFHPDDVLHAAAHKHVPLMETMPEEAVKNNVFGTLNVAAMADRCGVERFVLISTDKAVRPSSVMGATKRVAELVVRHLGQSSKTRMAAVRFGNVLGSAGSVVPLFREQIARGGPVTVTHPDCTRFFMTIPEAVGLVLLAGLGGYGELCVLDMGEPVRIEELARNLITLSGHVVGAEIPIVYTGLRPGEKLQEQLLTEDEERTQEVRRRIHVAHCAPPPGDLENRISELWGAAQRGDRPQLLHVLRELVPTFRTGAPAPAGAVALLPVAAPRGKVASLSTRSQQA